MAKDRRSGALDYTAENIGAALDKLAGQFDALKRQRSELGAELQRIVTSAQRMLADMGPLAGARARGGASPAPGRKGGRPKGYAVSAETRAKLKAAWERRRAAAEKDQTKPLDQRATIRRATGKKFSNRQRGKG